MEAEKNISGISENLSDSIADQKIAEKAGVNKGSLNKRRIAISVSESEELEQLGLSEQHLKDISIEIARYLIVNGASMLYGGDLRRDGFTELFAELSYQYKYLSDKESRFINYFPFPNSNSISDYVKANLLKQQVEAKIIQAPKHLGNIDLEKKYAPFENVEDRFVFAECFADMRIKMANDCNARIVLGGRQKGFLGYFPGIVEETFHSLCAGKPLYLIGGFGGATKSIIEIISGRKAEQLTNEFQFDTEFLQDFRKYVEGKSIVKIDYDFIVDYFRTHSIESISKQNGLTVEENQILFESTNIHELVFLIIKGLQNISK
jgi:hypothetical protein